MTKLFIYLTILNSCILGDQITKLWARTHLNTAKVEIISNFFYLHLNFNTGAAFSSFSNHIVILTIISFLASIFILIYTIKNFKELNILKIVSLAFILAGAFANFIDRFVFQKVTDFISILNFPVFNIADICLSLGACLFLIALLKSKETAII